ncbi:dynein regulatory complex subunit 4 [Sphaeramia orbicularis]|uniref:dynein regulatory complex subunit 4 n=1 Tax=Sphaeramia orbicularis TaxID=375764 RepID=UPI00117CFBD6|nr:dynein regulatory complex subunit 4-like [Sphaeramia orbicularis]
MPPKNKGSSKKPPKVKTPTLIDGLTKDEMTKEQLEEHIARLREELDREREERNYFQLERDKIQTFWDITERQLKEAKAELTNLDRDVDEDQKHHQIETKVYKQKMKHLLCEHQNTVCELSADGLASSEVMQTKKTELENEIHDKIMSIRVDIQERDNESLVKETEKKHEDEIHKTRESLEKKFREVEDKYKRKLELLREELDNKRKSEICEREEHWNKHIATIMEVHKKALNKAREFINSTEKELDLNISLKKEIENENMKLKQKEKDLTSVLQDNKHLAECLSKVKEETFQIEKQMKHSMSKLRNNERFKERQLNNLMREHELLKNKFREIQQEGDELSKSFTRSFQKLQQKTDVKNIQLEKKLNSLTDTVEKTQTQLVSVLSAANVDQTAHRGIINKVEETVDSRNDSFKDLQHKKAQICKVHKDLLLWYESKLQTLGVPAEELCVKPPESNRA